MEEKTTTRHHFTASRAAKTKQAATNVVKDVEKLELSYPPGRNGKWCGHFGTVWQLLKKLNMELPSDPAISLLAKRNEKYVYSCTHAHTQTVHE